MTSWKQYPHLFANGKFKAIKKGGYLEAEYKPDIVYGCKYGSQFYLRTYNEFVNIDKCLLIARPISDMTDEELDKTESGRVYNESREWIINDLQNSDMGTDDFLYLLSIGVYPFSDDTDVIF